MAEAITLKEAAAQGAKSMADILGFPEARTTLVALIEADPYSTYLALGLAALYELKARSVPTAPLSPNPSS